MYIPLSDDKHQMVRDSSKNALASADVNHMEVNPILPRPSRACPCTNITCSHVQQGATILVS